MFSRTEWSPHEDRCRRQGWVRQDHHVRRSRPDTGRSGRSTLALDCDSNPNLGLSLGLDEDLTESLLALRDAVDAGEEEHASSPDELVRRFGVDAPDGVRLAVVTAIQNPQPGCP